MRVQRVGVMYSDGPHFEQAIDAARRRFTNAHVVALVPERLFPTTMGDNADEVATAGSSARDVFKAVRQQQFDGFVILFDSPRLRLLSALSGAGVRYWCDTAGELHASRGGATRIAADFLAMRLRGRLMYMWLYVAVRLFRAGEKRS